MEGHRTGPGERRLVLKATRRGVLVLGNLAVMEREESDQLPEEGPPEQVPDDDGGEARPETEENEPVEEGGRVCPCPPSTSLR